MFHLFAEWHSIWDKWRKMIHKANPIEAHTHALHFHFFDPVPVFEFPTLNTNTVDVQ